MLSYLLKLSQNFRLQGTRAFAAAPKELTLPPQHGVPGRYAAALYLAAAKANKLQAVEGELASIAKMMADSQDFSTFVFDPSLPRKAKIEGLDGVLGKMGASDLTKNFMRTFKLFDSRVCGLR